MNALEEKVKKVIEENGGEEFAQDVLQYGCQSGCVSELITYQQTHKWFDTYYNEIEQLREAFEEETGTAMRIDGDLKNFLNWWSFEYVTFKLFA